MGNVTSYHYDSNSNRISMITFGELIDKEDTEKNIRLAEVTNDYDEMDRLIKETKAFFDTESGDPIQGGQELGKAITVTEYNNNSQVIKVIDDNGHHRLTFYDTANRVLTQTDHKGNTVAFDYDANSNIINITEVDKSDLENPDETFVTVNSYDGLDRLIKTVDPLEHAMEYAYDSRNNKTVSIDALGNMIRHTYDGLDRLLATTRFLTDSGKGEYEVQSDSDVSQGGMGGPPGGDCYSINHPIQWTPSQPPKPGMIPHG